ACKACLDAQKLLADIQLKNLSTKDMHDELENNKLRPSQIEQLNCVHDCLQALVEGSNKVISNEQKSIDELAQASKHGNGKKLLADIQSKNLSTKDMHDELENNKLGPSQIEQSNCVHDLMGKMMGVVGEWWSGLESRGGGLGEGGGKNGYWCYSTPFKMGGMTTV
nr:hypothetical protein [Tanacetum cinerariifolium]